MRHEGWGPAAAALLLLLAVGGCASRPAEAPAEVAMDAHRLIGQGRFQEARRLLEGIEPARRTAEQSIQLGESCLGLADLEAARSAFYEAGSRPVLTRALEFRLEVGLGDVHLGRLEGFAAEGRFQAAAILAGNRSERDRTRVGRARALLLQKRAAEARKVRSTVTMPGVTGLARLDAELGALEPKHRTAGRSPALAKTGGRKRRTLPGPPVISRARWRARPPIRGRVDPMRRITRITLHHTGDPKPVDSKRFERMAAKMRAYQSAHMNGRGWADLGYHYLVDKQGRIWEGRQLRYVGAHAGNTKANINNVGVALLGNFDKERPTAAQKKSLHDLVLWLARSYRIPSNRIYTHNRVRKLSGKGGTACPGHHLAAWLPSFKGRIKTELGSVARSWRRIPEVRASERGGD